MKRLPDALVIVDAQYEDTAIKEAKRLDIPVIAIVDSNTDPNKVDYAIPANDDSMRTIQLIISALADSIIETKEANGKESEKKDEVLDNPSDKKITKTKSTDLP
jgi:small subunit ribosomal protein S2